LSDDIELLKQRVSTQQEKFDQATGVVDLAQARFDTASAAFEDADRERKRVKTALKLAQRRASRLAKEAKRTEKLARTAKEDRDDAETELAENHAVRDRRQAKMAKAQATLSAAQVQADLKEPVAPAPARSTIVRKQPAKKAAPAKKSSGRRTASTTRAATTGKKGPARKA
jgi:chromosome segregation ATPase